ncbi:MAG: DoxX family protein [Actinomycetota bacterium]
MTDRTQGFLSRLVEKRGPTSLPRTIVRVVLGLMLVLAGVGHLTVARVEFRAQVPAFLPLDPDFVVIASGIVEIVLGAALVLLPRRRVIVGLVVALFFVAIFPGNIAQWLDARDGFGLDTDAARFVRLFFQPVLVLVALWATAAWRDRPRRRTSRVEPDAD